MLPSVHILCSPFYPSVLLQSCALLHIYLLFLKLFLFPGSHTPSRGFYFMFNIWQDAGNRTRVAATVASCATNELHTYFCPAASFCSTAYFCPAASFCPTAYFCPAASFCPTVYFCPAASFCPTAYFCTAASFCHAASLCPPAFFCLSSVLLHHSVLLQPSVLLHPSFHIVESYCILLFSINLHFIHNFLQSSCFVSVLS